MGPSLRPVKSAVPQPRKGSEEYKTGWQLCLEAYVAKGRKGRTLPGKITLWSVACTSRALPRN